MGKKIKGVILAGGLGTRLRPSTNVVNKHLLNVYNKPMIYHPIETLISNGIKEIMVVCGQEHAGMFVDLLKDGRDLGVNINITYGFQHGSSGIADALKISRNFVGNDFVAVILGDNYFEKVKISAKNTLYVKEQDGASRFGVLVGKNIIEKPKLERGLVVTGLYVYQGSDLKYLDRLLPSKRGELEITDFNNWILKNRKVSVVDINNFWSDMGTPESLLKTAQFIAEKTS